MVAGYQPLTLTVREYATLVELARRLGRIVSRQELFEAVWGRAMRPGDRSIDVYVHRLRLKLEEAIPDWQFIHTHVGFGYRFASEPSRSFHMRATDR